MIIELTDEEVIEILCGSIDKMLPDSMKADREGTHFTIFASSYDRNTGEVRDLEGMKFSVEITPSE